MSRSFDTKDQDKRIIFSPIFRGQFDALHTQKETIAIIHEQKGDYVGESKGNQSGHLEETATYFNDKELHVFYKDKDDFLKTV